MSRVSDLLRDASDAKGHNALRDLDPLYELVTRLAAHLAHMETLVVNRTSLAKDGDPVPRPAGCLCHWEMGDSPCPVHGNDDTGVPFGTAQSGSWTGRARQVLPRPPSLRVSASYAPLGSHVLILMAREPELHPGPDRAKLLTDILIGEVLATGPEVSPFSDVLLNKRAVLFMRASSSSLGYQDGTAPRRELVIVHVANLLAHEVVP